MKLLILLSRFPYPLEKGDKLRAYYHIRELSRNNEIILCALNTKKLHKDAIPSLQPYCKSIHVLNISHFTIFLNLLRALFSSLPFQVEYFYTKRAKTEIDSIIKNNKPDHIICQLVRVAEYVRNYSVPKTLDYQDVFSKGMQRRMNISPFYIKWIWKIEYKRLLKYENSIFDSFDKKLIISEADRVLIPHPGNADIYVITNGVDTDYFKPDFNENISNKEHSPQKQEAANKDFCLIFTGNMGYYPNVISAIYLVRNILPEVYKHFPDITLLIAGANPDRKIKTLNSDKVTVTGWVEDIRECYAKAKILIAPMQLGTGLQNKLLEAMAMKLPCITSNLANEGLGAKPGNEIMACETVKDYADSIKTLLCNKEKYDEIADNGYNFVKSHFNWSVVGKQLQEIIKFNIE